MCVKMNSVYLGIELSSVSLCVNFITSIRRVSNSVSSLALATSIASALISTSFASSSCCFKAAMSLAIFALVFRNSSIAVSVVVDWGRGERGEKRL